MIGSRYSHGRTPLSSRPATRALLVHRVGDPPPLLMPNRRSASYPMGPRFGSKVCFRKQSFASGSTSKICFRKQNFGTFVPVSALYFFNEMCTERVGKNNVADKESLKVNIISSFGYLETASFKYIALKPIEISSPAYLADLRGA